MSEVSRPKKIFAKSTITALVLIAILYILVNVSYVFLAPTDQFPSDANVLAALRSLGGPTSRK